MKSILGMFATLLSIALLTIYPNDLKAQDEEKPWHCKGKCRTWVVYDIHPIAGEEEPRDHVTHMAVGDKFQIRKDGSEMNFVALSQLRGHWGKEPTSSVVVGLTPIGGTEYRGNPENKSRLCGFPDILPGKHDPAKIRQMFKIKLMGNDTLQIMWKHITPNADGSWKTLKDECAALDDSHGGIAHAKN